MSDLLSIARRFLATRSAPGEKGEKEEKGEKGEKREKLSDKPPLFPLSPFYHSPDLTETVPYRTACEPWDQPAALRLMAEADALVEKFGVDGRHPAIVDAAAMVGSAFETRDMETVRFATAEFAATVRGVIAVQRTHRLPT